MKREGATLELAQHPSGQKLLHNATVHGNVERRPGTWRGAAGEGVVGNLERGEAVRRIARDGCLFDVRSVQEPYLHILDDHSLTPR